MQNYFVDFMNEEASERNWPSVELDLYCARRDFKINCNCREVVAVFEKLVGYKNLGEVNKMKQPHAFVNREKWEGTSCDSAQLQ